MPIYSVQGPDGRIYDIEGPAGASEDQIISALQGHISSMPAPKKGLGAAVGKGLESAISQARTGIAGVFNPEEAATAGLQRGEDINDRYASQVGLDKVKDAYTKDGVFAAAKEVARQVPLAIAEQTPNLAVGAGGARLGAMAGSPFGPAGALIGGGLGAAAAFYPMVAGGHLERQAQEQQQKGEQVNIDSLSAYGSAVPSAGLEALQQAIPFGGRLISKLTGIPEKAFFSKSAAQAEKIANERLLTTLAKGTAKGTVAEIPPELAQLMMERAQAGLSLSSPDAMKEYGETAYQVGLLGPLGAVGRFSDKSGARQDIEAQKAAEAELAGQAAAEEQAAPQEQATPAMAALPAPEKAPMLGYTPEEQLKAPAPDLPAAIKETVRPPMQVPEAPKTVQQLMDEHDSLHIQQDALYDKMSASPQTLKEFGPAYKQTQDQLNALRLKIEELGGTTETPERFETQAKASVATLDKKIESANKAFASAMDKENRDIPAGEKAAAQLEKLTAEREALLKSHDEKRAALVEKTANLGQRGQTREMFTAEEAPVPTAATKEEALSAAQPTEVVKEEKPAKDTDTADLFTESNILRTAVSNKEPGAAERAASAEEQRQNKERNAKADQEKEMSDRLIEALDKRLDQAGTKRERVNFFARNYLPKQQSEFKNGTNQEVIERERLDEDGNQVIGQNGLPIVDTIKLQDVYDKGGPAAVEYELIKDEVDAKLRKVSAKQGNAKMSVLKQIDAYNADIATMQAQLDSGIATPTMGEKVENLKAKQGKAKERGPRKMDAKERSDLEKKVKALTGKRDKLITEKLSPVQKEIQRIHAKLYKTEPVGKASEAKNRALSEAEAKQEKSAALKAKALELGQEQKAYKDFVEHTDKLLAARKADLGEDSPIVKNAISTRDKRMEEKALELGKATPEYKAMLAKEIKERRDAGEVAPKVSVSRTARTAARIKRGDVRYEAEKSSQMLNLAETLGMAEPAYDKYGEGLMKRLTALQNKYGKDDNAVTKFRIQMTKDLKDKAVEIGKTTPEYKATLKQQIEYFQEVLPTAGKQEVPTKRTTQVTRRVGVSKEPYRTGSPESRATSAKIYAGRAASIKEQESIIKDVNDSEREIAFRTREDEGAAVDAKEAADFMEKVQSKLPDNVKMVYAANPGKIPVRLLKMMQAEGVDPTEAMVQGAVFPDGTVLVVGDQHADLTDLEATVLHELVGHYGIDTLIGKEKLQAYADKTDLRKLAEEIGGAKLLAEVQRVGAAQMALGRSEAVQRYQVLREIIAHTTEARVNESFRERAGRWLKELVGMVRAGLRNLGFTKASSLSTSDIFYALKQSQKAFANKTIGVYRAADGQVAFRTREHASNFGASFIADSKKTKDKLMGNFMGLTGRVQFVDQYAALSEAMKRGVDAKVISSLEAEQSEFYLRFGQQRSQFAGQALTNGPLELSKQVTDRGTEYTYASKKGANMIQVAEALEKGKFENDTEAEAILTAYVAGQRAEVVGWNKLNFNNPNLAKQEHAEIMRKLNENATQKAAVEEAAKIYKEYNDGLVDFLEQTGAITPKLSKELKSKPFIPFYRVNSNNNNLELLVDKEHAVRIGNIKDEPQLKELVGGNTQIMPIFTSSVQNTFMLTDMALRNQMVKDSAFTLKKLGIASVLGEGTGPKGPSTVRFKVKGEDYFAVIDQDLYGVPAELIVKGMEGIKTTLPAVIKAMGIPANILRQFVTRNPVYAVRQVVRDPLNAWLTTGTDATPVLSSMKELASMVAGRSEAEAKLMGAGAISSNVFTGDVRDMGKFLKEISTGKSGWDKAMARLDAFAMQGDAATRAVVYKDSLDKGMSEMQSLLRTLESMNFGRRGLSPSMQALSIMIPFFNAQIQGLDVLYRAFTGNMPYSEQLKIRQKLFARGLMIAAGTMAYAAMMQDDEAYKRAKPEERLGNWFVYIPGVDEPLRVPIPFELGYLFKSLPEAVMNTAFGDEKVSQAAIGMGKLIGQTNPFSLPQAVKPLTETVLGKSFFAGDIESKREQGVLATDRYRDSTTEIAKILGSVTGEVGLSPIKIDYLIRGYTGGLGIALVQLANPLLNTKVGPEVAEPSLKASKTPFIGGLFQPVEGRGTLDEAYDRMLEIQQTKGTLNRMIEKGERAEAMAFAQEHSARLGAASVSGSVQQKLGEFSKMRRQVTASPTMTTEQKDEALKRIDKAQTDMARRFMEITD